MEKLKKKIVLSAIICFVIAVAAVMSFVPQKANASTQNEQKLPYQGYSGYSGLQLHNYSKRTEYGSQAPAVTVLVHGQGGNAGHWSNNGGGALVYNELSVIEQIRYESNADVYVAEVGKVNDECKTTSASHYYYTDDDGVAYYQCNTSCKREIYLTKLEKDYDPATSSFYYSDTEVENLSNFDNHNVIVFQASNNEDTESSSNNIVCGGNNSSHDVAYTELEIVIDSILADYKYVTGVIPKINLISHSRGGILSMMYAINHPYNVASLISMGTPYNGSLFGTSNWIVDGLELNGAINCPSGQDIQSLEKQVELRCSWNDMLVNYPDAHINAVAIGSKTQLNFIAGLLNSGDLDDKLEKYQWLKEVLAALSEYAGAAIAQLHNDYPILTNLVFKCADIAVDIGQLFADEYTAAEIEALQQIINNCEIAYGDLVIKDDIFIHYDSQTALGYNGITAVTHVFDKDNANYGWKAVNDVAIPHNLETRDLGVLGDALLRLDYGSCQQKYASNSVDNRNNIALNTDDFAKIEFNATYSGNYTVTLSAALSQCVVDSNGNILANATARSVSFRGEKGNDYSIYIGQPNSNGVTASVSITMEDLSEANGQAINAGQTITFVKSYSYNTVKTLQFNSSLGIDVYKNGNLVSSSRNGNVDVMFEANAKYYFEVTNTQSSSVNLSVNITNVEALSLDSPKTVDFYGSYRYNSFTGTASGDYTFSFTRRRSAAMPELAFYNSALQRKNVSMMVNYGNVQVFKMSLSAGETVFFGFVNEVQNVEYAEVLVKKFVTAYTWKLDGKTIENSTLYLQRNGPFTGKLSFYYNDTLLDGEIKASDNSTNYLSVSPDFRVKVNSATPLTYGNNNTQSIVWSKGGNYRDDEKLTVIVMPQRGVSLSMKPAYNYKIDLTEVDRQDFGQLKETVSVGIRLTNSKNDTRTQSFTLTNSTYLYDAKLNYYGGYFGSGQIVADAVSLSYSYNGNYVTYYKSSNPELFNDSSVVLTGYFSSGSGFMNDPYVIKSERELNNIRYTATYDSYDNGNRISSYFKLGQRINLQGNWTPIEDRFVGEFDGRGFTIDNLKISVNKPGKYGLFSVMDGTVKNLYFEHVSIGSSGSNNSDYTMVGTIAGLSNGNINDCRVYSGSITVNLYNAYVGGVAGLTQAGRIYNTDNKGVKVSGYGTIGGIVGYNSWDTKIVLCYNYADITYTFNTVSGCAGGIVGRNNMDGRIESCTNYGDITYGGSKKSNTNNRPCMAQIIGWNQQGTYTNVNCKGTCDFGNLYLAQRKYCEKSKPVGREGN